MRRIVPLALVISLASLGALAARQASAPAPPTFQLFFLGHDVGTETDTVTSTPAGRQVRATFHFLDRSTAVDLTASLNLDAQGSPTHFLVKGRNYRLFTSDAEVTVASGRAHVRDLTAEHDIDLGGHPFFPVDNYAPIGGQEALIRYWLDRGRPAEIATAPAGPVRIRSLGSRGPLERLAIDGVVWGTEDAWIDRSGALHGLTTWAGALPFEATREGEQDSLTAFREQAADDRVADLGRLTSALTPARTGTFALVGATVIDGTDRGPIADATIIVRDARIEAVGPSASTSVPRGVPQVDVHGRFITAGLWDMHAHASQVDWALPYVAGGVTTIRDMGGEDAFLTRFRDAIASGTALGPRDLLAGLVDGSGPQAFGIVTADTPEQGVAVVRKYHDERFDQVKIYDYVNPDVVKAITGEAHRLGMTVTGHVPRGMTAQSAVEAGFDHLAHMRITGQPGSDAVAAQIAFFKAHGTVMDPTESWNELGGHSAETSIASFQPGLTRLPLPLRRMFASMTASNRDPDAVHAGLLQSLRLVHEAQQAGLLVVAGTDKGVPGFSVQRELELYVQGGMTPLEAIQAATIAPARAMKLDGVVGTIEPGKRADLVVLSADPLEHIANIRSATAVIVAGRLYDAATLWTAAGFLPH